MGADLYINATFKKNNKKYETYFNKWVKTRNGLTRGTLEYITAQEKVGYYYDKMYSEGYFRDSYNDGSLMWMFDLSWWTDIRTMLNRQGNLTPAKAKELLKTMKEREETFETKLSKVDETQWNNSSKEEIETYFRDKYESFKQFLNEAVKLNKPISCSI